MSLVRTSFVQSDLFLGDFYFFEPLRKALKLATSSQWHTVDFAWLILLADWNATGKACIRMHVSVW
jgi:hypothetical protein